MKVRDMMHDVTIVDAASSVYDVSKLMSEKNVGSVLVSVNGEVNGIFTERDLLNRVVAQGLNVSSTPVERVMTHPVMTIDADATVLDASRMLNEHDIRRLAVTDGRKIMGIVTATDVAKNLPFHSFATMKHERDYDRIGYYEDAK
jgi:signal-transduction protein with cAMP-binding, CBS, and nucleotidyltransferase domain